MSSARNNHGRTAPISGPRRRGSGNCGDDPGLAYCEIPSGLQWLRGPRPIAAAWAAYERHLGVGLTG
jgi:hypothetical protein